MPREILIKFSIANRRRFNFDEMDGFADEGRTVSKAEEAQLMANV
jgi:hypothetical protein